MTVKILKFVGLIVVMSIGISIVYIAASIVMPYRGWTP